MHNNWKVSRNMGVPNEEKVIRPDAVAIYVRWSTEEQGEGTTLQEQTERCKSYVASQGWRVNESLIYIDDGYSGATLHRPAMTVLRDQIRKGRVDCVVSLKIDRLSRSLVDCVDLVLREWKGICHYKSVSQPVNTTDELSRVFFAILAGFAEYERALIRERTTSGLLRRIKEGNFWGSGKPPYGYDRVDTGKLAINETEATVVRMIFDMAGNQGMGPGSIATRLNDMGIVSPEGKGWWPYTVRNILKARIYIGYLEYGRRYIDQAVKVSQGKRVLRRREQPLVSPEARIEHLILVDDQTFERTQRLLADWAEIVNKRGPRARSAHLLTGVAKCRCGGSMLTGYDRLGRRHYHCANVARSNGGARCTTGGGFVYADQIEPAVSQEIKLRFANMEETAQRLRQRLAAENSTVSPEGLRQRLAELKRQEEKLADDLARVVRQARREEISLAEKRAFEADIDAERDELRSEQEALEKAMVELETSKGDSDAILAWAAKVDQWEHLPEETKREVVRHLIDYLVVYKRKGRGRVPEVDFFWRA